MLRQICAFLNLSFQEPMLQGYEDNPYYPGARLDTEKAQPRKESGIDSKLPGLAPSAYKKYQALAAAARGILARS